MTRVLLTNDDGPPSTTGSPFVYPFALALKRQLGWNVSVVVPSSQKSWVGKSFLITQTATGNLILPPP
jgi:tubulin--tyrosine ligase